MPEKESTVKLLKDTYKILDAITTIADSFGNQPLSASGYQAVNGEPRIQPVTIPDPLPPGSNFKVTKETVGTTPDVNAITLVDGADAEIFSMTFDPVFADLPPAEKAAQAQATAKTLENLEKVAGGKAALETLPDVARGTTDTLQQEAIYNQSNEQAKAVIKDLINENDLPMEPALAAELKPAAVRQDRSRVSKEYHEYVYCVHTSWYWVDGVDFYTDPLVSLTYIGPETGGRPSFGDWVDYPDLRQLFKIFRYWNRRASACGGKALWQEQGYADKKEAVRFYVYNEDGTPPNRYSIARDALISASPNFTA